jgi:hypothetical protein
MILQTKLEINIRLPLEIVGFSAYSWIVSCIGKFWGKEENFCEEGSILVGSQEITRISTDCKDLVDY